jgi:hypothetical protein
MIAGETSQCSIHRSKSHCHGTDRIRYYSVLLERPNTQLQYCRESPVTSLPAFSDTLSDRTNHRYLVFLIILTAQINLYVYWSIITAYINNALAF